MMLPRVSVTRYPEIGDSDFFGPLLALPRCSGDLGCLRFLSFMVRKRGEEVSKGLSARGDGSGKWKRRDGQEWLAREIEPNILGPMPVQEFLDEFFPNSPNSTGIDQELKQEGIEYKKNRL